MTKQITATVTLELHLEPGGPPVTVQDAADWTEALLNTREEPEGYNSARYSRARVVSVSVKPQ